jgi:murein DD-endopeptidase MepM/ murein hydrolase activator NlpD
VPAAEVSPPSAFPGDAVLVTVTEAGEPPGGTLAGRPLRFWPAGPGRWQALAPLPIETEPGPAPIELSADGLPLTATLEVRAAEFRSATLTVPPQFVEPPPAAKKRMALDQAAFDAVWARPFEAPRFAGAMRRPLPGVEISSWYGDQRRYNGKLAGTHYGLDLAGKAGDPVEAAADGEVALARDCYMTGLTVVLAHGPALFTVYFHQSKLDVKAGDRVAQGQVIGRVGSTGRSTGAHLHWGIKVVGLYVHPERFPELPAPPTPPPPSPGAAPAPPP